MGYCTDTAGERANAKDQKNSEISLERAMFYHFVLVTERLVEWRAIIASITRTIGQGG
jgi:hypothetical protein